MRIAKTVSLSLLALAACSSDTSTSPSSLSSDSYFIGGTVSGLIGYGEIRLYNNGGDELIVEEDGEFQFDTAIADGDVYAITADFSAHYLSCEISHDSGTASGDVTNIAVVCDSTSNFADGQEASVVIGADDFETNGGELFNQPWGSVTYAGGKLFVPDSENHRILIFDGIPTENGAQPTGALGQENTTDTTEYDYSASVLPEPVDLSSDGKVLVVTDCAASRVTIYNTLPSSEGGMIDADVVLGQGGDFSTDAADVGSDAMDCPYGSYVGGGKLLVADNGNNRVLIYNSIPTESGTLPDIVLGQADFDSNSSDCSDSGMNDPAGVWTDGERILVADERNHRVLIYNSWPTENGVAADVVLGQTDFDSCSYGSAGDNMFYYASKVVSDGTKIYAIDYNHNRVLIWNSWPTENGVAPDHVLGQEDLSGDSDGLTASTMQNPYGLALVGTQLIVTDYNNDRILVYNTVAE